MFDQPTLIPCPGINMYEVVLPYEYGGVIVPDGYFFNGANIPPIAQFFSYTPFHPDVMAAALIHDYLYDTGELSRKEADVKFRNILIDNGVDPDLAYKMYYAVRAFGHSNYSDCGA